MTKARIVAYAFSVVVPLAGVACRTWVAESPTGNRTIAEGEQGPVRVVKRDNSVVMLTRVHLVHDTIFGTAANATPEPVAISVAEVRSVGTRQVNVGRSAALGIGVIIGLLAVGGIIAGVALSGGHGGY